jgi:hypothetical protein
MTARIAPNNLLRNLHKRKGHPATGWPSLFQGRIVPTEGLDPSKLSEEIL